MSAITIDAVGTLNTWRQQDFSPGKAILELVDNSVDAGATEISIINSDGDLKIIDNGEGFENILDAINIGTSSKTDSIGRYGIGFKHAVIKYSNATIIESRGLKLNVPWLQILNGNLASNAIKDPIVIDDDRHTSITLEDFTSLARTAPLGTDTIAICYAPRLLDGSFKLDWGGQQKCVPARPEYIESIDKTFQFRDKLVKLTGGIYHPSAPERRHWIGYYIYYRGRLIVGKITDQGTGNENCTSFCFWVELIDDAKSWVLTTNKENIDELDELLTHCYDDYTRELLIRGAAQTQQIELKEIEQAIGELAKVDARGNIRRKPPENEPGPAIETGKGPKKERTNTADADGVYEKSGKSHARKLFDFKMEPLAGDTIGRIQSGKYRPIVILNSDNSFVSKCVKERNNAAIGALAMAQYCARFAIEGFLLLPNEVDRFSDHLGTQLHDGVLRLERAVKSA